MVDPSTKQSITVSFTIEGDAEVVLAELRKIRRVGDRRALLTVRVPDPANRKFWEDYVLPEIRAGDAAIALEHLVKLSNQRRVNDATDHRLGDLVEEYRTLTK